MALSFIKQVDLAGAGGDLISYLRAPTDYKIPLMLLSCVPPALIVGGFYLDARDKAKPPPPEVIYFESWPATRTREESQAANIERQKIKDDQRAAEKAAYMALGRATGIDVDKIDREVTAEQAAKKAEDAKKAEAANKAATEKQGATK